MTTKEVLHGYVREQRQAMLAKLDGVSEADARRPRTVTGTNLLGVLKHCALMELGYLGDCFGRPAGIAYPWDAPGASLDDNLDFYATADESMADVLDLAHRAFAHADATVEALDLDAKGFVPWWGPEGREVTLDQIIVHLAVDEARHAGHMDVLREQLDGSVGLRRAGDNLPEQDERWWADYVVRLHAIADAR